MHKVINNLDIKKNDLNKTHDVFVQLKTNRKTQYMRKKVINEWEKEILILFIL